MEQAQLDDMRTFGYKAYALLDPDNQKKLVKKSTMVVYLGPRPEASIGHVAYDPAVRQIESHHDLVFFEQECVQVDGEDVPVQVPARVQSVPIFEEWYIGTCTAVEAAPMEPVEVPSPVLENDTSSSLQQQQPLPSPPLPPPPPAVEHPSVNMPGNWDAVIQQLHERFSRNPPIPGAYQSLEPVQPPVDIGGHSLCQRATQSYTEPDTSDEELVHTVFMAAQEEKHQQLPPPQTFKEAQSRPDWNEWLKAMLEELSAVKRLSTYPLIRRQPLMNILKNKWVFAYKFDTAGQIERYKARIVVKGFGQRHGIDYNETFSPTAKMKSIKVLLAIAAVEDLEAVHMDVSTAFLNGTLKEKVYMEQPEGFEDGTDQVCLLHRTLYGLKQSPREWYKEVKRTMVDLGFSPTAHNPSVFMKWCDGCPMYIGVYVDDMLVVSPSSEWIDAFYTLISQRYKVKNLGNIEKIIGMWIH